MSEQKNLGWMYEGPKSIINREDYLLGKKIDRNFELFSDVVVKDKDETDELLRRTAPHLAKVSTSSSTLKTSALETNVVRNEDPLVALRLQEEKRRQEILNNPLLKMKAEKVLRKEFEKLIKKSKKKHKRKSTDSSEHFETQHPSSKVEKKSRRHSKSPEPIKKREKKNSTSKSPKRSSHSRKRSKSPLERHHHRHQHKDSKNDNEKMEGKSDYDKDGDSKTKTQRNFEYSKRQRSPAKQNTLKPSSSSSRLTAEEKEAKRKAMLANANWRDEVRNDTVEKAAERLREEEKKNEAKNPTFLKSLLSSATNSQDSSVEKRLQSNKQNLQRSGDYMSTAFASRK